jgi:protein Hikeshi
VNELCLFLLPGVALPPNAGLLIYWQLESGQNGPSGFELLGSLTPPSRSSDIFRTGWSDHGQFLSVGPNEPAVVNVGISVEPLDTIHNLTPTNGGNSHLPSSGGSSSLSSAATSRRPLVAHRIAQDLFNFMQSFDTNGATGNQTMAVPANIFDRWWNRFETKLKRDPNFFLKNGD